eukprot:TRINITY_DN7606_c0_g1_i1.p1 TRINITY_DN7606_c0_g1~~TRINITY_DN7606_c0_g1_i1.p1  ORF type:complete len:811 (-),score=136.87 TRINITY_DN7606_c0_g1_i1:135-2567(-)
MQGYVQNPSVQASATHGRIHEHNTSKTRCYVGKRDKVVRLSPLEQSQDHAGAPQENNSNKNLQIVLISPESVLISDGSCSFAQLLFGSRFCRLILRVLEVLNPVFVSIWVIDGVFSLLLMAHVADIPLWICHIFGCITFSYLFVVLMLYQVRVFMFALKQFETVYLVSMICMKAYLLAETLCWRTHFISSIMALLVSFIMAVFLDASILSFKKFESSVHKYLLSKQLQPHIADSSHLKNDNIAAIDFAFNYPAIETAVSTWIADLYAQKSRFGTRIKNKWAILNVFTPWIQFIIPLFTGITIEIVIYIYLRFDMIPDMCVRDVRILWMSWRSDELLLVLSANISMFLAKRVINLVIYPGKTLCLRSNMMIIPIFSEWQTVHEFVGKQDQTTQSIDASIRDSDIPKDSSHVFEYNLSSVCLQPHEPEANSEQKQQQQQQQQINRDQVQDVSVYLSFFSKHRFISVFSQHKVSVFLFDQSFPFGNCFSKELLHHHLCAIIAYISRFLEYTAIFWIVASLAIPDNEANMMWIITGAMILLAQLNQFIRFQKVFLYKSLLAFENAFLLVHTFILCCSLADSLQWRGFRVFLSTPLLLITVISSLYCESNPALFAGIQGRFSIAFHEKIASKESFEFTHHLLWTIRTMKDRGIDTVSLHQLQTMNQYSSIHPSLGNGQMQELEKSRSLDLATAPKMSFMEWKLYTKAFGLYRFISPWMSVFVCLGVYILVECNLIPGVTHRSIRAGIVVLSNETLINTSLLHLMVFGTKRACISLSNPFHSAMFTSPNFKIPIVPSILVWMSSIRRERNREDGHV